MSVDYTWEWLWQTLAAYDDESVFSDIASATSAVRELLAERDRLAARVKELEALVSHRAPWK